MSGYRGNDEEMCCLGERSRLFWCSCAFVSAYHGLDRREDLMEKMVRATGYDTFCTTRGVATSRFFHILYFCIFSIY